MQICGGIGVYVQRQAFAGLPASDLSPCCTAVLAVLASASIYRGFTRAPAISPGIGIPSWIPIVYAATVATASGL